MSGWGDGEWGLMPWGGGTVVTVPGSLVSYRLVLAQRGTSGLGTPIITDVLSAGVPMDTDSAGRWSRTLNAAGTLEFSLPIDGCTPEDFAPGQRELHLYRDDGSGERLAWAGHLWAADVRAPWVRFLGMGFYEALRHREISDDFYKQNVEQRSIAWQLIDYTQNQTGGALGITRATAAGSAVTRTVLYCAEERQVIADAIEDLASADDGFDFDVGPDKVWRTWTPERGTDLAGTVELDTTTTIVDMSYTVDGTQVENDVAGIGKKGDCEPITFKRAIDTTSRDAYGLMQGTVNRSDLNDDDMLAALTAERLALLKDARKQPTVRMFQGLGGPSPLNGDFDIGDTIAIKSSWGYATFHERFRVMSYSVSFDRLGNEMLELVLDSRGTIPGPVTQAVAVGAAMTPAMARSASNSTPKAAAASTTVTPGIKRQVDKTIAIEGTNAGHYVHTQSIDVTTTLQ